MENNILSSEPDIYAPIKKFSLQTFSSLAKKVSSKKKNGDVIELKNSKELFAKLLLIAKNRNLDLKEVLQYSLRPFPLSLATLEGNLVKSTKSKLLNIIENEVEEALVEHSAGENALIIDAMALLQSMKIRSTTFGELALEILTRIVQMASFSNSKRVDLVCDRYPDHSIKTSNERNIVVEVCSPSIYTVASKRSHANGKIFSPWGKIRKKSWSFFLIHGVRVMLLLFEG
jgi:hypothetical protein